MENKITITNLYNNLSFYKIDSKTRINIISNTYDIDRSTIFKWMNDSKELIDNKNNNIIMLNNYKNKNITFAIETLIINNVSKYNSINKLKKFINTTLNTYISNNMIKCILASNNIKFKNFSNINIDTFVKNNCIDDNKIIITKKIESYIINNKDNSIVVIMNNVNLNFNIKCTKKDIISILQKNKIHKKNFYKITSFVDSYVYDKIKINNILTAKQIIDDLYKEYNINISTTSVYNIYKKHNLTFKKIKFNNNPKSLEDQKERILNVKTALESVNLDNVISYDEMSIVLNSKPTDGWSDSPFEKRQSCYARKR
jgi:hypothetical protein